MIKRFPSLLLAVCASLLVNTTSAADDRFANVEVKAVPVAGSVYMLVGSGGNIGVSAGSDGLLLVDDQYAPLAQKIMTTLGKISDKAPSYIINTHYHGDHTGANAFFRENKGATIFAHENVRIRLASGENAQQSALPVVTYQDGIKFHFNGDTIHVFHLADGHTDGDSAVWFEQHDVLHTGDLFFKNMFPYIDLGAGGSVDGYIESVQALLARIDNGTKVIPGHGSLATKADLQRFVNMIKDTHQFVQAKKAQGMTEEQVVEAGLEEKWNTWAWAFITESRWIKTLYQ
jgi:glyoxylase-like metal-dependent hydrolase (beta-lactamase superfamily II)